MKIFTYENFADMDFLTKAFEPLKAVEMMPSTVFLTTDDLRNQQSPPQLEQYFGKAVMDLLKWHGERIYTLSVTLFPTQPAGVEMWVTNIESLDEASSGYLHVDCDEVLRKEKEVIQTPIMGSILYLNDPADITGGQTVLIDPGNSQQGLQLFKIHPWHALLEIPDHHIVSPALGKLVTFEGNTPHAVGPTVTMDKPRLTLLANVWFYIIPTIKPGEKIIHKKADLIS